MKFQIALLLCFLFQLGCNSFKKEVNSDACNEKSIILELRRVPSASSIDITNDYFLLIPQENEDSMSINLGELTYSLHFLDLNAPHGAKNCCLQKDFHQNTGK